MYVYTWNLMFSISSGSTFTFTYFDITYLFSIRQTNPKYIAFKWYTLPETNKSHLTIILIIAIIIAIIIIRSILTLIQMY